MPSGGGNLTFYSSYGCADPVLNFNSLFFLDACLPSTFSKAALSFDSSAPPVCVNGKRPTVYFFNDPCCAGEALDSIDLQADPMASVACNDIKSESNYVVFYCGHDPIQQPHVQTLSATASTTVKTWSMAQTCTVASNASPPAVTSYLASETTNNAHGSVPTETSSSAGITAKPTGVQTTGGHGNSTSTKNSAVRGRVDAVWVVSAVFLSLAALLAL
ncbi:hypothetical protein PT974_10040 [Cladobotryum mycophilum]|uniref:Uncharacterized protein n=1 Tax=Cladobotryum mycophilum TaxID=491253 RepID=A0ABR0S8R4_9HYPO